MSSIINETLILETQTCCVCGIVFAMPQSLEENLRKTKYGFYCPNGHEQSFTVSEADRLKKQLEEVQTQLRASKCEALHEKDRREQAERKLNRVKKGVCPCCNRSFRNLQRHMQTKHPEVKK